MECKRRLIEVLVNLIEPFYRRRKEIESNLDYVTSVLEAGSEKANARAEVTLMMVKEAIQQKFY
jgi:tryptophanyl-tRNA synthetase